MKTYFHKLLLLLFSSVTVIGCSKEGSIDQIDPLLGYSKLQEGYALGASAKVEIWGKKNYFMGFNNLTVVLYDSLKITERITDAHIQFKPIMTMVSGMGTMQHACPVENPDETAINKVFPGAIAFIMPTSTGGNWSLDIAVHNHKYDKEGVAKFNINVDNPTNAVLSVFTTITDGSKLVLSILQPTVPKVGMNDIEFTIHKKVDMMTWPADDSYAIEITPEMPSMGHGSPNNVNPTSIGNGHYKGKINFTMTGEWKINILVKKDGTAVSSNLFFNTTL